MVAMGHEGRLSHFGLEDLAALLEQDFRAMHGGGGGHIGHGDRPFERRREAAAGNLADLRSLGVDDERTFANRLAPFDEQADALADRALFKLRGDALGTGETAAFAAALGQSESEVSFD